MCHAHAPQTYFIAIIQLAKMALVDLSYSSSCPVDPQVRAPYFDHSARVQSSKGDHRGLNVLLYWFSVRALPDSKHH